MFERERKTETVPNGTVLCKLSSKMAHPAAVLPEKKDNLPALIPIQALIRKAEPKKARSKKMFRAVFEAVGK